MDKRLPITCPACGEDLKVQTMHCESCETTVTGMYHLPLLASLEDNDQVFVVDFIKSSGNLKIMAKNMGLSYPTVRNLLDKIINRIKKIEAESGN